MTPERLQQVEELYHAALRREPERRANFLKEACGRDEALRREVESLIFAQEQEGSFIDSPAYEATNTLTTKTETETRIGRSVAHYNIVAALGKGGMGDVYLAHDTSLHRKVAIKFLPRQTADAQAHKRLIREAQVAACLDHQNICAIHEVGRDQDQSFIVMQYVEGDTLASCIRRRLKVGESLAIATQVADALSEAHSRGIIHRDIKPGNIVITPRGQAKLMDFGIAKFVARSSPLETLAETDGFLTSPGAILGTVPYMSPEQVRGEELDGRSDIFSLGVVLYEMVSGRQPFSAKSAAVTLSAILSCEPPPISAHPDAPAELQRIARKCMEKDRERRYQSARDLLVDLNNLARDINSEPRNPKGKTRRFKLAVVIAAVLALTAIWVYLSTRPSILPVKEISSIAVLPLTNTSGDAGAEYFSDGITESIINKLSQLSTLKVMARTTVFRYKGPDVDFQKAGRDLGVDWVLTGKAAQRGETLAIQVELVNAADGSQLWGDHYDGKLSVLAVQEEIAKQIVRNLQIHLTGKEQQRLAKHDTENTEAYGFYLMGRYHWNKRTAAGFKNGIEFFTQAIQGDPDYARAYAGLADSYNIFGSYSEIAPKDAFPMAKAAATRALQLDEELAEAHASLGDIYADYDWNWPEAEKEFKRAIELSRNYAPAHQWYSQYLARIGRFDEALSEAKTAQALEPRAPIMHSAVDLALYWSRQYDAAIEQSKKTVELDANFYAGHMNLGLIYLQKRMYDEAISEFQKARTLSGNNRDMVALVGHSYAVSGNRNEALMILAELKKLSRRQYVSPLDMALIYIGLGEKDIAFEWMEKAYQDRVWIMGFLKVEPIFDSLRPDPRFAALLRRIGLP